MSAVLARWNLLSVEAAADEILPCCGSWSWAELLSRQRPLESEASLLSASDEVWNSLTEEDWCEAFRSHPKIGDTKAPKVAGCRSDAWSVVEQRQVADASEVLQQQLAAGNREYESKFSHIFIVCATGKSPEELLKILQHRLNNDSVEELHEAAEQQRQITHLRLRKWLRAESS